MFLVVSNNTLSKSPFSERDAKSERSYVLTMSLRLHSVLVRHGSRCLVTPTTTPVTLPLPLPSGLDCHVAHYVVSLASVC